jgi:hypothetical protein
VENSVIWESSHQSSAFVHRGGERTKPWEANLGTLVDLHKVEHAID